MGLVHAEIELVRTADLVLFEENIIKEDQIKKMTVTALVDSGAYMLAINETVKAQLDLRFIDEQIAELADGSKVKLEIVGPVEVRFGNRSTTCRAVVLPGDAEILLGAIPMEDMDVIIHPREQKMMVNPKSPNYAQKSLK
ncbi:MAG: clan AA aspartic protease [Sphingobacteriales bacterium]|nr:MAG: clan AA aspartic protease [Sphingobacteriales bacterium]